MITRRQWMRGCAATAVGTAACLRRPRGATVREVEQVVSAVPGRDGAGVALRKSLGSRALPMLDPFLMLDEIRSSDPADYQAGFPDHPHRGFETVSYVLEGGFAHADSVGNHGLIADGGAQWMTAGRGLVHSEMPRPTRSSSLWGLQLWVNLPAAQKMIAPRYQDLDAAAIPTVMLGDASVRVVAGAAAERRGPVDGIAVAPTFLDATLAPGARFVHELTGDHAAFAYVLDGTIAAGLAATPVAAASLAVLGPGGRVELSSRDGARVLLIAGAPIREPVARRGPFVMNTEAELDQAFADYRAGRLRS